jgi:hypothetical protein
MTNKDQEVILDDLADMQQIAADYIEPGHPKNLANASSDQGNY